VVDDSRIGDWFERNYRFITYEGEHGLVATVQAWIVDLCGCVGQKAEIMDPRFVLPNGIGDVTWALTKIRAVAGERPIHIILSGQPGKVVDRRAVPFLERFDFVSSVMVMDIPVLMDREAPNDAQGRYRYVPDGRQGDYHFLVPNKVLEEGRRLEEWLPEHPVDWDIMRHFSWKDTERGDATGRALEPFVAFYLGPETGHTDEGHNKNWLWEPSQWVELGLALKERGVNVAVVGADYDRSFWERYVRHGVTEAGLHWFDLLGQFEIGETFALLKHAKALISYQCGLVMVSHYLGVPCVSWWRPDGNSMHPKRMVSFHNEMRNTWIRPGWEDKYLGCLYKRESAADIIRVMDERGWLKWLPAG
jgi:hypothetical protein